MEFVLQTEEDSNHHQCGRSLVITAPTQWPWLLQNFDDIGGDKDAEEARKNSHPYEKDSCKPELTHPTHGSVFCSNGNKSESVCQYTCDEGYQLSDPESSVLICKGKNWSGKESVCVADKALRQLVKLIFQVGFTSKSYFKVESCTFGQTSQIGRGHTVKKKVPFNETSWIVLLIGYFHDYLSIEC
ncbi:hypothetical protein HOLleu_04393 [Holothuria leucospilota]|uniref:Sushi domain-containing protein n=1 Tax=Holothuria leucospilota TaxID=206669 RepID=A0A9Q1CSW5_HOLLE|nr:hypothetical protein HOLleu_04393 [Holothuria leucospilota]